MFKKQGSKVVALVVGMLVAAGMGSTARAGFFSYSDSRGNGQADTRVRNFSNTLSNQFLTAKALKPSSGFNTNLTLTLKGTWPSNATTRAVSRILDRGIISNSGTAVNGDGIDSGDAALDALVEPSSSCSSIELTSTPVDVYDTQNQLDPFSYRYVLDVSGSDAGTALKVTWYDWLLDGQPADQEDLIANGRKLAELLFVGPIDLANYDCVVVRSARGREFIHVVTAGTATSLPFTFTCPSDVVVSCDQLLSYPSIESLNIEGGVAPYTVTYDPPLALLPDGATNTVSVTVSDANGCTANTCEFSVIRSGNPTFTGFEAPISGVGGTCAAPLRVVRRGSNLPVKFNATCNGVPITTAPRVEVRNCLTGELLNSGFAIQQTAAVWHYNTDTSLSAFANVTLEITVFLPGGSIKKAVIRLRG